MRPDKTIALPLALSAILAQPLLFAQALQQPTPATAAWWAQTTALSNDSMEGRDTGTEAYERAAKYVANQFLTAHLKPAGDDNTYLQRVPMHQVDLDTTQSTVTLTAASRTTPLHLLEEVTLVPRESLPADLSGSLLFLGYGLPTPGQDLHHKVAVFFSNTPAGLSPAERDTFAARRSKALAQAGAVATLSIDNPAATEPTHWPAAYSHAVTLAGTAAAAPASSPAPVALRISAESAAKLFAATSQAFAPILEAGEHGALLTALDLNATLSLHLVTHSKDISSPNILAILPGADPTLAPEYVALSAHLDGYGYGTPVLGDKLYNGTLDDAAYVALLLELAKSQASLPQGNRPRRSLLFCILTGEEKGLLGSAYFTAHPTVPVAKIVADLNLDQLRPIFPLKILTMEGITDSTLGETARTVAARFNIELRPDLEPERNLFRRSDNYNFVRVGVPIASFIFGYDRGSKEEVVYRDWYARRYHKPQDDLATLIDWNAAATFNQFYSALALAIANTSTPPAWSPSSPYAPAPKSAQAAIPSGCATTDGKLEKCH